MAKINSNPIKNYVTPGDLANSPTTVSAASAASNLSDKPKSQINRRGVLTLPSRIVYALDVPEIKNLIANFIYNYYVPSEVVKDKDILSDETLRQKMNISQNIVFKKDYSYTDEKWLFEDNIKQILLEKIPRYIKIQFTAPKKEKIPYASGAPNLIRNNITSIVKEETFSSNYYTSLYFNNADLDKKTSVFFESKQNYTKQIEAVGEADPVIADAMANQPAITKGANFFKYGQGIIKGNSYLESLKKLSTTTQVSNNLVHDLIVTATGNPLTINEKTFKSFLSGSAKIQENVTDNSITEEEFKTSLQYYEIVSSEDSSSVNPAKYEIVGYTIEKFEIFPDGSIKNHDPIIIENPTTNSVLDLNVRYGTVYAYHVRTIMSMTYAAVNNLTYETAMVKSLVASKPVIAYAETLENVGPPPPVELKAIWDYDRINPLTSQYDPVTGGQYKNTGKMGTLLLHWSFPINSQMDIKKFQVFRRRNVDEPFELIKMFDFNDSMVKFPDLEESINFSAVENTGTEPRKSYYDDEFTKNSDFIYAIAAIDAHGLTSNYSEQIRVTFDVYKNKLSSTVISSAGAPKQYPNLFLKEDLFVDTMKTSNKKTLEVYFTPDCYSTSRNDLSEVKVVKSHNKDKTKYKINFVNLDNQDSAQLDIKINDRR